MKAFPIEKFLTSVLIVFFACLSWGQEKKVTRQQCIQQCDIQAKSTCTAPSTSTTDGKDPNEAKNKYNQCIRDEKQSCIDNNGCSELDSTKDIKQACEAAFNKYSEAGTKSSEACAAFDSSGGKTCKDKAASCDKKIKNLSNPYGVTSGETPESDENGYGALKQVALANIYQQMGISGNGNTVASQGGTCVKSIDRKARAQEKKDKDRERKEMQEKIKQQKDKIVDYKEDLDKERNENSEKIAELDAENKKDVLAKDKSISDETSKISKEIVDIGRRLRGITKQITDQMQALARVNFKYQTDMLALSDENTNIKCKQTFESLKATIVNSKMSTMNLRGSPEEQQQYAALAALANQYKAQGIKGSGELKNMLIAARKQCYETANTSRNKLKLENSQTVETIQNQITELKTQMSDEKTSITTAQKNLETQKAQVDKEKQQAESEKLTKLDNLSKKLANQISNSDQKTKNAKEKIDELTKEIANLTLVQNFEVEDAYSEASEAIQKGISARNLAIEACGCEGKAKTDTICSQLSTDQTAYDGKSVKSKTSSKK